MCPQSTWRNEFGVRRLVSCAMLVAAVLCGGCASWQLPRIDPTGESLLIWPNQQPVVVVGPPPGATVITSPGIAPPFVVPAAPPSIQLPAGNVQAAPVYSDVPAAPLAPRDHRRPADRNGSRRAIRARRRTGAGRCPIDRRAAARCRAGGAGSLADHARSRARAGWQ